MSLIMRRQMTEVCKLCGTSEEVILRFIQEEWLIPFDREHTFFDDEDVARIHLIMELKDHFGVNDEGIPIILHLVDELNAYRLGKK